MDTALQDTIAAIATPPGEGAIAIIRISGKDALEIAERIFSSPVRKLPSHTAQYGKIFSQTGEIIDEVLLLPMHGPKSFTGEDTVEIFAHGGSFISKRVLARVLEAGALPAKPGEFTFRAFRNGKIDLSQAEAIQKLIGAKNELALKTAQQQLQGELATLVSSFQEDLISIAAILEAWVDFPEEGLEFTTEEALLASLEQIRKRMEQLIITFERGKIYHKGATLCICGSPNVGKSSLMNALLREERSIVTPIPGTTRDFLSEDLYLNRLHCKLVDTAGIRVTDELIEQKGIERSKQAMASADLLLLILDASRDLNPFEQEQVQELSDYNTIIIYNKIDLASSLPQDMPHKRTLYLSAKTGEGIEKLIETIEDVLLKSSPIDKEEVTLTEERHKKALENSVSSLFRVEEGIRKKVSAEFVAADIRFALQALGAIIGKDMTEEILTEIFSRFCIGK